MVELWADQYSPLHEALTSLGPELNDALGVCASRVRALPPPGAVPAAATAAAHRQDGTHLLIGLA